MKVKLYSNLKLFEFILPSQVFGTFTFDEDDDNIVKLINIEAIDNAWYLVSVEGVKVFNNKASEVASVVTSEKTSVKIFDDDITYKVKLEENNFYVIERVILNI